MDEHIPNNDEDSDINERTMQLAAARGRAHPEGTRGSNPFVFKIIRVFYYKYLLVRDQGRRPAHEEGLPASG
jgi:hypothetical protein